MHRKESEAIGAATEDSTPKPDFEAGPTVLITLLLTTGKRHPYKIDAKYLRKRNVTVEDNDPWNLPVQTLKELILRDWREGELDFTSASAEASNVVQHDEGMTRGALHEQVKEKTKAGVRVHEEELGFELDDLDAITPVPDPSAAIAAALQDCAVGE
jgi:hypothetical protein